MWQKDETGVSYFRNVCPMPSLARSHAVHTVIYPHYLTDGYDSYTLFKVKV